MLQVYKGRNLDQLIQCHRISGLFNVTLGLNGAWSSWCFTVLRWREVRRGSSYFMLPDHGSYMSPAGEGTGWCLSVCIWGWCGHSRGNKIKNVVTQGSFILPGISKRGPPMTWLSHIPWPSQVNLMLSLLPTVFSLWLGADVYKDGNLLKKETRSSKKLLVREPFWEVIRMDFFFLLLPTFSRFGISQFVWPWRDTQTHGSLGSAFPFWAQEPGVSGPELVGLAVGIYHLLCLSSGGFLRCQSESLTS